MSTRDKIITQAIAHRARGMCAEIETVLPTEDCHFYMAGGCLTGGDVNDIDLFPGNTVPSPTSDLLASTKNASTYKGPTCPVQVCRYCHTTLTALVESFDFAHIQVGVSIVGRDGSLSVDECYFTDAFVQSQTLGISWFTGSAYPLASLIRAAKYYNRGAMPKGSYMRSVLSAVSAVVVRGFNGYEDFKDQLDAVDLGLIPSELGEVCQMDLVSLFEALDRQGQ